jgi:glutathione S-transferase
MPIVGAEGSPYSRKLRAVLRFRRIPYRWVHVGTEEAALLPRPSVELAPQLILAGPSGEPEARTDTTPLIRELEQRHDGRSVLPPDPVLNFLNALIEDYADEWLTKCMFHYRWAREADIANARSLLPRWSLTDQPDAAYEAFGKQFGDRQIARLWVVGSNETTGPLIEDSYRRLLSALDRRLSESRFLLGRRPASADFALFGQLTQLTRVDPTPRDIAHSEAPRIVAWVDRVEDLSGIEVADDGWIPRDPLPDSLRALLAEIGRVYAPFLVANGEALERGADRVECAIDGSAWVSKPFRYQGKCLAWLRADLAALADADRRDVDSALEGTGCEALFA